MWHGVFVKDYDDFESNCDDALIASMASTCCGSQATAKKHIQPEEDECPGKEKDWENCDKEVRPEKIEDTLKHLGNVKKRKLSPMILKDVIGDDGVHCLSCIKKSIEKLLKREVRKIKEIHIAVSYSAMLWQHALPLIYWSQL